MPTRSSRASSPSRARLSLVLLLYFLGVIGVITLAPFRFVVPRHVQVLFSGEWFDDIANVLLFVPLGFLYPLTRSSDGETSPLRVFFLGALLSGAIETTQLLEPERVTSAVDVLTNSAGAALGAVLARAIVRRIRVNARLVGRLSLEIPLVGLIYLLLPLLVVASLDAGDDFLRMLSLLPLGLVGARLFSAVQRNHFGPAGLLGAGAMALVSAGWMVLGVFPIALRYPLGGVALVAAVAMMTVYESSRPLGDEGPDRRFETRALRSAAPYLVAFLLMIVVFPLGGGLEPWHWSVGLTGSRNDLNAQMLRLLEPVATMTVLGWLLAEARGRRELPFARVAARVGAECAMVALVMEASRGLQRGEGASVVQLLLVTGAGLLGAGMYHHQRDHVRWILAHRADRRGATAA